MGDEVERFEGEKMMGKVKDKLRSLDLGKKPYWFPLISPTFLPQYPSILVPFGLAKLPIDYSKTLIMVESGGLLPKPPSTPDECLEKQMAIRPDLALTLDFPVKKAKGREWHWLSKEEKNRRVLKTIHNAKFAMKVKDAVIARFEHEYEPVAVIQGYDIPSIINCSTEMYSLGYEFYAHGSITTQSSSRYICEVMEIVEEVRNVIGKDAWLHILGVMSLNVLVPIREYISSFDASTVIRFATKGILLKENGSHGRVPLHVSLSREDYVELQEKNFKNYLSLCRKYLWIDC